MAWNFIVPAAIAGLSSLFGSKGQKTEQSGQRNTSNNSSFQNSSAPNWDPETLLGRDVALQSIIGRILGGNDMSGYEASGLDNINAGGDAKRKIIENIITSRGLGRTSLGATAIGATEGSRVNEATMFRNSIPLVQRQMQGEDIDRLSRLVTSLPIGQTSSGVSNSEGVEMTRGTGFQSNPSNPFDAISQIAAGLAGRMFSGNGGGVTGKTKRDTGNY